MDRLIVWLGQNVPADDGRVALVHGDWRIDNMILTRNRRGCSPCSTGNCRRSAIRSPILAYHACNGGCRTQARSAALPASIGRPLGIPSEADYVAGYCRRIGLNAIPDWTFLIAFSFFRVAAIVQGVYKRSLDGDASNPERAR